MKLKTCDSCGGDLAADGRDLFWAVRCQIQKATIWTQAERDRAATLAKMEGNSALGRALADAEPATFIGDRVPSLMTHVDLRICVGCVVSGGVTGGVNVIDLIRAAERGPGVPTP